MGFDLSEFNAPQAEYSLIFDIEGVSKDDLRAGKLAAMAVFQGHIQKRRYF